MLVALLALSAHAVPMQLTQQGRVFDSSGAPFDGTFSATFTLYNAAGTPLWSETSDVPFEEGYFAKTLGLDALGNPLQDSIFDEQALFIGLAVDGGAEGDRQPIFSVPYAVRANTAENVIGGTVDVNEIKIDGTTIIDSTGTFLGTVANGATLGDLTCGADSVALYNGTAWICASADSGGGGGFGDPDWDDLENVPAGFADDVDNDSLGTLSCNNGQVAVFNGGLWTCADYSALTESDVESFVTNGPLNLDAGTLLGSLPISTGNHIPALTENEVEVFVTNGAINLAPGSTMAGADLSTGAHTTSLDWDDITGKPNDLDTLASLACGVDQVARYNGVIWTCADHDDVVVSGDNIVGGTIDGSILGTHAHDGADITTGTVDGARLGAHTHDASEIATGTLDPSVVPLGGNGCPGPRVHGVCVLTWDNRQATNFQTAANTCAAQGGDICTDSQNFVTSAGYWQNIYLNQNVGYNARWTASFADNDSGHWPGSNGGTGDDHSPNSNYGYICCGGARLDNPLVPVNVINDVRTTYVHNIADTYYAGATQTCAALHSDVCTDSQNLLLRNAGALTVQSWTASHSDNDAGLYSSINGSTSDDTHPSHLYGFACCAPTIPSDGICPVARTGGVCAVDIHDVADSTFAQAAGACASQGADVCSTAASAVLRGVGQLTQRSWSASHSDNDGGNASVGVGAMSDNPNLSDLAAYACCMK